MFGERPAGHKHVDAIQRSAKRMHQLIESLRDATMIEIGRFTIHANTENVALLDDQDFNVTPRTPPASVASRRACARALATRDRPAGQASIRRTAFLTAPRTQPQAWRRRL